MSRRSTVTLKGEAAGAFLRQILGHAPLTEAEAKSALAARIHAEMKAGNTRGAEFLVSRIARDGVVRTATAIAAAAKEQP